MQGTLGGLSPVAFKKACAAVETLRTFDEAVLHGGRKVPGDLRGLVVGGRLCKPQWPSGTDLIVRWPRSAWRANRMLWQAIVAGERPMWGVIEMPTAPQPFYLHEGAQFQEVGQKVWSWISFRDIDKIVIG